MIKGKIRTAIKSNACLYRVLLPIVSLFRWLRMGPDERVMNRFRRYCLDVSTVVPEPTFVKVGANDGITGDPCSDILLASNNWQGLLIEPIPYYFDLLKANFQDTRRFSFEQIAIGQSATEATFYYVSPKAIEVIPNLPLWWNQLGSFDRSHILKHLNGALEPFIVECKVQVSSLSDVLLRNSIQHVHLLHVDAEGHDYEVIKTLDFTKQAPVCIFFEHKNLPETQIAELLLFLRKQGYSLRKCWGDYFALHEKAYKRLQHTAAKSRI